MILKRTVIFQGTYCLKNVPYNHMAYELLMNEIGLILPTFPKEKRPKRIAILASVLGGIVPSIMGLAYEGISSFLHHKRHKALHKAVKVMERKTDSTTKSIIWKIL